MNLLLSIFLIVIATFAIIIILLGIILLPEEFIMEKINKFLLPIEILIFKIRNRPKFKKGDLVEWIDDNDNIKVGTISGKKTSIITFEYMNKFKRMYEVQPFGTEVQYYMSGKHLQKTLSIRREENLNKLLNI